MAKANITINGRATVRGKHVRRGPCIIVRDAHREAQHFAASIIAITHIGGRRVALVVISDSGTHHSPKTNGKHPIENENVEVLTAVEQVAIDHLPPGFAEAMFNSRAPEPPDEMQVELPFTRIHVHGLGCEGCGRVDLPTALFDGLLLCSECRHVVGGSNGTPTR